MAKFLDTTGVSYHLQQLINNANGKLILISPYLKINDRIKQSLEDKDRFKLDIRLIYGKNELQPEENNWLRSLQSVRSSFCENLHAKCYLNESQAIVTSMNLYEFSQVNNNEMGILVDKAEDPGLYQDVHAEAMRLIRIGDEIRVSVEKVKLEDARSDASTVEETSFCIRCKVQVPRAPSQPLCRNCYGEWSKYKNREYGEKYCHLCGREDGTSMAKPACYDCFKSVREARETDGESSETDLGNAADTPVTPDEDFGVCPKCGKALVRRASTKGKQAGDTFLGCSGFPKCWYKAELPE